MIRPIGPGPGHIDAYGSPWSADVSLGIDHDEAYDGDTVAMLHLYADNIDTDDSWLDSAGVEALGIELTRGDLVILIDRLMDVAREIGLPLREPDPPRARCGRYDLHGPHTGGPGSGVWCVGNENVIVALTAPDWGEATHSDGSIFSASPSIHAEYEEWIELGGEA